MAIKVGWRTFFGGILAAFAVVLSSCSGLPATVAEVTIVNGTDYDLDVEVSDGDQHGWLPLAIVQAGATDVSQEVIDQGDVWVFRFRHWGDPVGELSLSRGELERSGWRVEVPVAVSERLRELGRPMAP